MPAAFLRGETLKTEGVDDLRGPFVDWLVAKDNPYFARALANRLWFYLFSRGIVNPIDDFHELNPPSHPGLLKLLANEFVASGYDIKHLFRCICNSQAYQRTSWMDPATDDRVHSALTTAFGRMPLRVMTADRLYDSLSLAFGDSNLDLRTRVEHVTVGMSAAVADPYLEFQRQFGTNEEDATDFTHGVAQMLTLINHPRLLAGSNALDAIYFPVSKDKPDALKVVLTTAQQAEAIEWLYLSTLSRRPTDQETAEAMTYVKATSDKRTALNGVLWTLINRSEYIFIR